MLESELATEMLTGGDVGFGVCHLLNYQGDNCLKRPFQLISRQEQIKYPPIHFFFVCVQALVS